MRRNTAHARTTRPMIKSGFGKLAKTRTCTCNMHMHTRTHAQYEIYKFFLFEVYLFVNPFFSPQSV